MDMKHHLVTTKNACIVVKKPMVIIDNAKMVIKKLNTRIIIKKAYVII